ncbi:hypothetical protein F8M41_002897 [Gigaspora margarita]|uniref:Uncharacterized protein n=1 Tax=Gigaspora margarita TaxID=4874 RepID=A0A8H3XEL1_GIGMA|nr:hypothetical protein F8M41_002897 [Gigaspora margarita]
MGPDGVFSSLFYKNELEDPSSLDANWYEGPGIKSAEKRNEEGKCTCGSGEVVDDKSEVVLDRKDLD